MAQVQKLPVGSSYDKRPIDAWMVTPPDFDPAKRYPMILEIHGGPFAAYGPQFSTDDQLYASAGYVVLYTNPRGSTSYGEEFANQIDKAYPGHDYDDLMSAVDAAIASGHVDPDNLFVTGGSGGGVLTAWIVGKTDRFRAAATQKPVIDWASFGLDLRHRDLLLALLVREEAVGRPDRLLGAVAAQPRRQRQDSDARGRRRRGLSHARQRGRAIL